jgi:glycosyltransferase involved in cell wall biosynthesis
VPKVLIVAETYPYPEHRNGLAKINANLLVPNPYYTAELLCVRDPDMEDGVREGIHQLPAVRPGSKPERALRYLASVSPMGTLKAKPYFHAMAAFICANHARFDLIHLSSSYLAGLIDELPQAAVNKTLLFAIDSVALFWSRRAQAERHPLKRAVYLHEYRRNARHERQLYPRFRKTVFVSQVDATFAAAIAPGAQCISIPNGVDIDYFRTTATQVDTNNIVFTGDLSYAPNRDAADFLLDEVMPRIPAELAPHLFLVGQRPSPRLAELNMPNVTVTGFVDDLRPYIADAALYVSPLRFGSGIKNKVLEAMAMGRTVIGTPVSFEGIDCQDERDCVVADTSPDDLAAKISHCLRNHALRGRIGAQARHLVEQQYSWDSIRRAYGKVYADSATHR